MAKKEIKPETQFAKRVEREVGPLTGPDDLDPFTVRSGLADLHEHMHATPDGSSRELSAKELGPHDDKVGQKRVDAGRRIHREQGIGHTHPKPTP